jgi:DNA-binding response OmpR family regulator
MDSLLCWPHPPSPDVERVLDMAGFAACSFDADASLVESASGALIDTSEDFEAALAQLHTVRRADHSISPLILLVRSSQMSELAAYHQEFEDFCVTPFHPVELEARLRHLMVREGLVIDDSHTIRYAELALNLETYQASIAGRPLDLTYMEYELLKYLAESPGRVFTREALLTHVWGYEYYGGARTVDVHVRRLRSKLGEEHAGLIATVRSVGYRFGEGRWG